jgi:hypothetical protein
MKFMRTSSTEPDRSAGRRSVADTFLRIFSRRRALIGAQAGALLSVLVLASTFSPGAPLLPVWLIWIVFVPIFPLHVRSVLILREGGFPRALLALPRAVLVPSVALALALFGVGMYSIATAGGVPERHGDNYYLRNHTELTPVSHATYLHAIAVNQRIFAAIPAIFYLLGVLVNLAPKTPSSSASEHAVLG